MDLSVIIPVYNEEDNIPLLCQRLTDVLSRTAYSYELIFVDDGSKDNSLEILIKTKENKGSPSNIRIVQLSRNFGQHPALNAGFSVAAGKVLVTIDSDLQIDPGHIPKLMDKTDMGYDFVSGVRRGYGDSFLFRRLPSQILSYFMGSVIGKKLKDYNCPLNAMDRRIAESIKEYGEMQRFFKPLAVQVADRIAEVDVEYETRRVGCSKYNFMNLTDVLFDFITNFSKQLFQRVALAGFCLSGASFLAGITYLFLRFPFELIRTPFPRLQVILLTGFVFGIQLLVVGILGDFIIRIYRKIDPGPIYTIKKIL